MGEPKFMDYEQWLNRNPGERMRPRTCAQCNGARKVAKASEPAKMFACPLCRGKCYRPDPYRTYEEQKAADRAKWERFCGKAAGGK